MSGITPTMALAPPLSAPRLKVFYALHFGAIGVWLPFIPAWLTSRGLSASQVGLLLALSPALALVAPPLWGQLGDRTGRPGAVLAVLSVGACVGVSAIVAAPSWGWLVVAFALHAVFASSVATLIDALTLHQVREAGGSYASIRALGSLGFVVASVGYGFAVSKVDRSAPLVALALLGAAAAWATVALAFAPARHAAGPRPTVRAALQLLARREVWLLLLATLVHWVASAPYHGTLSIHVQALGLEPRVVSLTAGVGVACEVVAMLTWPRWAHRVSTQTLLTVSFALSGLRWLGMGLTSSGWAMVALSVLHAASFGTFFVAAVTTMAQATPDSLRATGQALFVAVTFGLGGVVGFLGAGWGYDALGGHRLFLVAAALEVVPMLVLWVRATPRVKAG